MQTNPFNLNQWYDKSPSEIIDYIIQRFHQPHRHLLPLLIDQADYFEAAIDKHPGFPQGLSKVLKDLYQDLLIHLEREEIIVFPLIAAKSRDYLCTQLNKAQHHHGFHQEQLDKIQLLTRNFTVPENADETWQWFYSKLNNFCVDLQNHIELEEKVLFSGDYLIDAKITL
jgi:regulator of cell morphogenesis and NO signaling